MPCTVQDILNNSALTKIKILAGHNKSDTVVSWLNIIELLGDLTHLQEGELLLTTGFDLTTYSANYADLIRNLQSLKIASLVIKLGTYVNSVPPALIEQADKLSFPLLEIPVDVSLSKVSRSIISQLKENENGEVRIIKQLSSTASLPSPKPSLFHLDTYRIILARLDDTPEFRSIALNKNQSQLAEQEQHIFGSIESTLKNFFSDIVTLASTSIYSFSSTSISTSSSSTADTLALQLGDDSTLYLEDLRLILAQIINETKTQYGITISFGVSNLCSGSDSIPQGVSEAREALEIGKHILNQGYVTLYENVELYRLFLQVPERKALIEFSKKTLAKVVEYDQLHGTELVRTLETYIQNDHSIKPTAEILHIHRHTVKNRLNKIEEITKISFKHEERFQLEFALTLKHLYRIKF